MTALPVSCVITCFDNAKTLEAAVASVQRQTKPVAEIVIADDASSDSSHEIIRDLATKDSRIITIFRKKNIGVAANRDLAIRSASQPYITHLDGDDLFAPKKIESEWRALNGRKDAVAFSYIANVVPGVPALTRILNPRKTVSGPTNSNLRNLILRTGPIPRDMLISRELFIKAGGFTHDTPLYEDWQFKLRLAALGVMWICTETLGTIYFQRPGTLSRKKMECHISTQAHILEQFTKRREIFISKELFEVAIKNVGVSKLTAGRPPSLREKITTATSDLLSIFRALYYSRALLLTYRSIKRII